jgi:hypothetical protein
MGTPTGRETYGVGPLVVLGVQESCTHGEGAALQRGPELAIAPGKQGRYREVFFSGMEVCAMQDANVYLNLLVSARQKGAACEAGLQATLQS